MHAAYGMQDPRLVLTHDLGTLDPLDSNSYTWTHSMPAKAWKDDPFDVRLARMPCMTSMLCAEEEAHYLSDDSLSVGTLSA